MQLSNQLRAHDVTDECHRDNPSFNSVAVRSPMIRALVAHVLCSLMPGLAFRLAFKPAFLLYVRACARVRVSCRRRSPQIRMANTYVASPSHRVHFSLGQPGKRQIYFLRAGKCIRVVNGRMQLVGLQQPASLCLSTFT